jgi:uncharacterized cupredoxin-like copper-binding protein
MRIFREGNKAARLAALLTLMGCAGKGQTSAAPAPSQPSTPPAEPTSTPASADSAPSWLTVDSASRTVTLALEVTAPPDSPSALIDRYRAGQARITVPLGWTVRWHWRNADSTTPHSLVVMVQREKIPLEGGRPAYSNAMTRMVTAGLPPGGTDETTFVADEAGWYWLMCGVPGHALKGEWLELRVDPDAKTASGQIKKT